MKAIRSLIGPLSVALACLAGCGSGSGSGGSGGSPATGGTSATGGAPATGGTPGTGGGSGGSGLAGTTSTGGATGTGGVAGTGGAAGTGGTSGSSGATGGTSGPPALTVNGNKLQDPTGKTIVLRGASLIDIGSLYAGANNSASGITARIDKVIAAGVQGDVVRLPVYPKIDYNGGYPYCSAVPYPVGTGPSASCTVTAPLSASDYDSKVLKPAVDYATSKGLYVIIDHHQIDNATSGTSAADATTFWTDVAPQYAGYSNVLYEPFNEPIDGSANWATLKPVVQGWINLIRAAAPNNIIIVPSTSYDQHPGDAASNPPTGTNLMYTAHVYPGNWNSTFMSQLATATSKVPVFISEWGYTVVTSGTSVDDTTSATWGSDFQTVVDGDGASWTAWVTDNGWTPSMFKDGGLTQLTDFGTLVKNWQAAH
ncbi:MAG TPA: glycoside hydrolase family 5 protein [Polyangia bacterium]|nr:glycoside hydrolase family 5 protein [Polyangia bacterium]